MGIGIWPTWVLLVHLSAAGVAPAPPEIRLYNPTQWSDSVSVEVPLGRIASPGLVDWSQVQLVCNGRVIPHAVRNGRAHWKSRGDRVNTPPRAEDLLVFSCPVPPHEWVSVQVVPGAADGSPPVVRQEGRIAVSSGATQVVIDEASGTLESWELGGTGLLSAPFTLTARRLAEAGYQLDGYFSVGYTTAAIRVHKDRPARISARLAALDQTPAMTELLFLLEVEQGPSLALTYRVHASGQLEIVADEQPWEGTSPWLSCAMEYELDIAGDAHESLAHLENRWAFYGFREYTAAVQSVARVHAHAGGGVLELGEETVNGRRYVRRLFPIPADRMHQAEDLAELADEGPVITVQPVATRPLADTVRVMDTTDSPAVVAEMIDVLAASGVNRAESDNLGAMQIRCELSADPLRDGIGGDGFAILPEGEGVVMRAGTRLGLYTAVRAVAQHLARNGRDGGMPLVARNPVVDLRGGGFGGGDFEVDFPYGTDEEWCRVFDNLLDAGMNVFACMGMWANWKMPVGYQYMPELRSDDPGAYDESSGAKFIELEYHREHGLKLARYLQERGGQVWLWVPIGCVPTTFAERYPEAMSPDSDKFPCFTHPKYREYVNAFFRELLETYPLEGLFLVRDDNGGVCTCERCQQYVAQSRTKSPVWEQYLVIYDSLREHGFSGAVAVYPYHDWYEPRLDPFLPEDLYVVGHGAGAGVLVRDYGAVGPMGDTWLDNLYANFRVPPSPRMRRLLADRGSFWIGGAYVGCELPWEAIGYFGWEPTATPNSLRFDWAVREFGLDAALSFLRMNDAYEHLWDLQALEMLPVNWMKLECAERDRVVREGTATAQEFRTRLEDLRSRVAPDRHQRWFGHLDLFAPYFEYHLHRLDLFAKVHDAVLPRRDMLDTADGLPEEVRASVLRDYAAIYDWAAPYDQAMQQAPGGMLDHCRWMTSPYKEWMAGYDQWLDAQLELKQFAGRAEISCGELRPGNPFALRVTMHNLGICPWITAARQRLVFSGDAAALGLPTSWEYTGEPLAPGDRRTIEFQGTVPPEAGTARVTVEFFTPYRVPEVIARSEIELSWP